MKNPLEATSRLEAVYSLRHVSHHCCHIASQSWLLGRNMTNIIPVGLWDYIWSSRTLDQTCRTTSISPSPSALILQRNWVQSSKIIHYALSKDALGPNVHIWWCSRLLLLFPAITYLSVAASSLQQHIRIHLSLLCCCPPDSFYWFLVCRVFSLDKFRWECVRGCDCFGDGTTAVAWDLLHIDMSWSTRVKYHTPTVYVLLVCVRLTNSLCVSVREKEGWRLRPQTYCPPSFSP